MWESNNFNCGRSTILPLLMGRMISVRRSHCCRAMSPIEVAAFSVGRVVVDVVASGIHGEEVAMPEKPDLMVEEPRSTTTQGGAVLVLGGIFFV